jgi:hypothetical protein
MASLRWSQNTANSASVTSVASRNSPYLRGKRMTQIGENVSDSPSLRGARGGLRRPSRQTEKLIGSFSNP